jgi:hypothetical protein
MNDGLVVLAAWIEFGVLLAVLFGMVLRRTNKHPSNDLSGERDRGPDDR